MSKNRKKAFVPVRPYNDKQLDSVSGTMRYEGIETARRGSANFRKLISGPEHVKSFGALTGSMAVQMVRAGMKAIYVSGWQVAADMNLAGETYPDMSLYPLNSVPKHVERINRALQRENERKHLAGDNKTDWFVPIVADAEAGLNSTFELTKMLISAGAAAIHLEDQDSTRKKCGHLGGKIMVPVREHIEKLKLARLAADIMKVPTVIIARTDAEKAGHITSDIDDRDRPFLTGKRTPEGFYEIKGGFELAVERMLAYAPYAEMLWCETATPDLDDARYVAEKVHAKFPGKPLAYNCSPSFKWVDFFAKKYKLDVNDPAEMSEITKRIGSFQDDLGKLGYKFQFVTLFGWHLVNLMSFMASRQYLQRGMAAYAEIQQEEIVAETFGYEGLRHQEVVGTKYFDAILDLVSGGEATLKAMKGSTEEEQFKKPEKEMK